MHLLLKLLKQSINYCIVPTQKMNRKPSRQLIGGVAVTA